MDTRFSKDLIRAKSFLITLPIVLIGIISLYSIYLYISFDPSSIDFGTNTSKIYDKNNTYLWELSKDNSVRNTKIDLKDIPESCIQGMVAIEDKNFWSHIGVDLNGLVRLGISILTGGSAGGGSTIPQQVVKNADQKINNRSPLDKFSEAIRSIKLSQYYSKNEVLSYYMNNIFFGNLNYGIESASQDYFGKKAKDLTLSECSYIVGVPQWPGVLNPYASIERGKERQALVLDAMINENYISDEQAELAATEELDFNFTATEVRAPHYIQFVKDNLKNAVFLNQNLQNFTNLSPNESYEIHTPYDYNLHRSLLTPLKDYIKAFNSYNVNNASIVILNSNNEIEVMIGSIDFFDDTIDGKFNSSLGSRQPGTAIIPIIYAYYLNGEGSIVNALDNVDLNLPVTRANGVESVFLKASGPNPVVMSDAITSNLVNPSVDLLNERIGIRNLETELAKFQVDRSLKLAEGRCNEISMLEGCELSLLDLTFMYSILKNKGDIYPIKLVNNVILNNESIAFEFEDQNSTNSLHAGIKQVSEVITKDGITFVNGDVVNKKDMFSVGFNNNYTVGIWAGNTKGLEINSVGSQDVSQKLLEYVFSLLN